MGTSQGLNFNTVPPSPLTDGSLYYALNPVAMSDQYGKLQFYGNTGWMYNRMHQRMLNSYGLIGAFYTQNRCTMTMPVIGSSNLYYIFTADGWRNHGTGGYCYSILDMSLNGGLGDIAITAINRKILGPSAERLTLASHANGMDSWLVVKDIGKRYYSYQISCNGISSDPVVSIVGINLDSLSNFFSEGDLKVSPDNKLIAVSHFRGDFASQYNCIEVFQFDNKTGILSNAVRIPIDRALGIEFSPDSKKLYVSYDRPDSPIKAYYKIAQYDLSVYDAVHINGSGKVVAHHNDSSYSLYGKGMGFLQLGPDKKIYHASLLGHTQYNQIDVITKPDSLGVACDVQLAATVTGYISPLNPTSNIILPTGFTNLFVNPNTEITKHEILSNCRSVKIDAKTYIKGNNLVFNWDFGDGTTATQLVPSQGDTTFSSIVHDFPLGQDSFFVGLAVSSDTLCGQGTHAKQIVFTGIPLPPKPTAGFTCTVDCFGKMQFVDTSRSNGNGTLFYEWQFGDGQHSLEQSPTHTYTFIPDFVLVTLIVKGNTGCALSDTLQKLVSFKQRPIANMVVQQSNCGSKDVLFSDASFAYNNALVNKYLYFGDGTVDSTNGLTIAHQYTSYDSFYVKLVVKDANGCMSDTLPMLAVTRAVPVAASINHNGNACSGLPFSLTGNASVVNAVIDQYQWQIGAQVQTGIQPNAAFSLADGQYTVQLTLTSSQGCSASITDNMTVHPLPLASIHFVNGCVNQPIIFTSTVSNAIGPMAFNKWIFGNGDAALTANASQVYTMPGNYTVQFHAVSNEGCMSNTVTSNIVIESYPHTNFMVSDACLGRKVDFIDRSTNAYGNIATWSWQLGNAQTASTKNTSTTYASRGVYAVSLRVATMNGCHADTVMSLPILPIYAFAGNDTSVLKDAMFSLHGYGGAYYWWQPSSPLMNPQASNPQGSLQQSQLFTLKVTDSAGCIGYDSVMVKVLPTLGVPNTFSPNGDGINDTWDITGLASYPNVHVQVYNRYGQLVHEQKSHYIAWDGSSKGSPLPIGTYYFIITTAAGNEPTKGWVMVLR